jgi:hypothetical protein
VRGLIERVLRIIECVDVEIGLDPFLRLHCPMCEVDPAESTTGAFVLKEEDKRHLRPAIFYLPSSILGSLPARVVKWQTRTFEGRMPQGMGVQVPPRAPTRLGLRDSFFAARAAGW